MADKTQQPKEVESTVEEVVEKTKAEKPVEEKAVKEDKTAENGDVKDDAKEVIEEEKEKNGETEKESGDKCSAKRKSTGGGDATDNKPADDATPEKKAKLDEPAEAESKGKAEVAA